MASKNQRFGETIRKLRKSLDLSLRSVAADLGISPAYLCLIERGREGPPRPELIREMAIVLNGDVDHLFRIARCTDPELARYVNSLPGLPKFLRTAMAARLTSADFDHLAGQIRNEMASAG